MAIFIVKICLCHLPSLIVFLVACFSAGVEWALFLLPGPHTTGKGPILINIGLKTS